MLKNKSGFSLLETLITIIIVGILSVACGAMLIFAYSMFDKIMGNGTASIEYKMFRFRTEKIFRNMTSAGPLITNIIDNDTCSVEGRPSQNASEEEKCIKFDLEYVTKPYDGYVHTIKYNEKRPANATTKYKVGAATDLGIWNGHVGRTVSVYSCVEPDKITSNYRRYMMRMEVDAKTGKKVVVLYTWHIPGGVFESIPDETTQYAKFNLPSPWDDTATEPVREVLLSDVKDFQVTARLSNLYFNRIKAAKYSEIAIVRVFVQLGEDADMQYSNDLVFANKSIYGDIDGTFFESFYFGNIVL